MQKQEPAGAHAPVQVRWWWRGVVRFQLCFLVEERGWGVGYETELVPLAVPVPPGW